MANKPMDTSLLDKAIIFATKAHSGTERRGKGFPYIVHPLEAVAIVATMTSDQELLAAAALHDTVEDSDVTLEDIRANFGDRVMELVKAESDKDCDDAVASWHDRKQAAINTLASVSLDAKMVAMGDKLSNMRAIWRDYNRVGDELWNLFHVKDKSSHAWHYRGLAESLKELDGTDAYDEFVSLVNQVFDDNLTTDKMKKRFEPIASKCGEIVNFIMDFPQMPQDDTLTFKIRLCCEEAVQNVVDYAYVGGAGYLEVEVTLENGEIRFCFRDSGKPFDPLAKPDPDVTATLDERKPGGLGIFLCKQMMDSLDYKFENGCNCLTMVKKI